MENEIRQLLENLKNGEQSILLLNRRGFNTYVSCTKCKKPVECPNCSCALTYHKKNGRLMCHICGYSMPLPSVCPYCSCVSCSVSTACMPIRRRSPISMSVSFSPVSP